SSYYQDTALHPFVDQLRRASGFPRDDPAAARLEKLEAVLALATPPEEDVALLADLMSLLGSERHPLPDLSPRRKKERTLDALMPPAPGVVRSLQLRRLLDRCGSSRRRSIGEWPDGTPADRRLPVRRAALRDHRGADHGLHLSLHRLPAHDQQRLL